MSEPGLSEFERELANLINRYSLENDSDTPDFMLAAYLRSCLEVVAGFIRQREKWYGRRVKSDTEPLPPHHSRDSRHCGTDGKRSASHFITRGVDGV